MALAIATHTCTGARTHTLLGNPAAGVGGSGEQTQCLKQHTTHGVGADGTLLLHATHTSSHTPTHTHTLSHTEPTQQ